MTNLRIAKLTRYDALAASTRQRFDQFDEYLIELGCVVENLPLLESEYLARQYAGAKASRGYLARRYLGRARELLVRRDFDLLWIQYELFPFLPGLAEVLATLPRCPIVVDFDDAMFHRYDAARNPLVKMFLGSKLAPLLKRANAVFCGNAYLQNYAAEFCDTTHIVPTVLDTGRYCPSRDRTPSNRKSRIGWMGTPSTWSSYMGPMMPLLVEEAENSGAEIFAVGASRNVEESAALRLEEWDENSEANHLQSMDVGIMPLHDDAWARGKCGYKLIQYMACGLPVIASPVGVNAQIVEHGVNGFLAANEEQWRTALRTLLADAGLRRRMGAAGRNKVEQQFSIRVHGPKVASLLYELALVGRN